MIIFKWVDSLGRGATAAATVKVTRANRKSRRAFTG
jgi:hypothetical protein